MNAARFDFRSCCRSFLRVLPLILCCDPTASPAAEAPAGPDLLNFIAANRDRRYAGVPHEVLAFYYTWYGRPERHGHWIHWGGENLKTHQIPEATHYPALGAYDSQDPKVMDTHIDEAKTHGVTGFIATWWGRGTYEDHSFSLLLDRAARKDFKATIYWETAPGKGREQIDRAIDDLVYVLTRYGSQPAFLKVKGKPVIFIYGRVLGEVPLAAWPAIITGARARAGDFLLIADGYQESYARLFDGLHTYNICGQVRGKSPEALRVWSGRHYADAVVLARKHGRISCVTVIPGYDDTKIRKPGLRVARRNGATYRVLWEEALRANPDWVLITSWNEWHEGSEIEPSREDGERYLQLTAQYAPRLLARQPNPAAVVTPSATDAETRNRLQSLFKGRTIGLLPGFGDAAFWLIDAGLQVKELSWADVADPAMLNPGKLPVVLQAGGEGYASTGKASGDVVPALQQYLAHGGFLVSIPNQPFPFYYDETSGKPRPVANEVGLPVKQGWERPPAGARLAFHFNTRTLPGLPLSAPFPAYGDLRWRPAMRDAAGPDDRYVPLASLSDSSGRALGDGIVYVEHHTPPLAGGRTLYVWMRMTDVVGENNLMSAVFQFVGRELKDSE